MLALRHPLHWLYRRLGPRYPRAILALQFQAAVLVTFGGLVLLRVYQPMSAGKFWQLVAVAEALVVLDDALALRLAFRLVRPADPWLRGRRNPDNAVAAWHALTSLPRRFFTFLRFVPVLFNVVPIAVAITLVLGLPWYSSLVLMAGAAVVLLYGVTLRFLTMELTMRPVLADVSCDLPDGVDLGPPAVSLRLKLLAGLPVINIVTGVLAAGLSSKGQARLSDLGADVLVAVGIAFTISLELTVLLSRSILEPVGDLRRATQRVAQGDLGVRVPVVTTDETGALASSFNHMVSGLQDREKLREAFGSYVDPDLADRILEEGTTLSGEEVEVTVLFLDIRDFTAFAERSTARDVVGALNAFYERVVPVLVRHGGHANKFVGDGLLGVFGAPDRLEDHADRGVAAALEIVSLVRRAYGGELRVGVGVNSGPVVAGTIGGGGRLEFTVIGDTVNTAARVEEVTRQTGDDVLVTEATRARLSDDYALLPRGSVELKGKLERVGLYACHPVEGSHQRRSVSAQAPSERRR